MVGPGPRFATLIAAAPFLMALAVQMFPERITPVEAAPAPPPLAFDQYSVDLGLSPPAPVVRARFEFTNTGDQPVTISELQPSCGCLDPRLTRDIRTYLPGERGRFDVKLETANEEPGPHMFTVTVKYEDSQPHEDTVVFRVTLPEQKVTVDPPELVFYQLNGEDSEATVYISDHRDGEIDVLAAEATVPGVHVEVLAVETGPDGRNRTPIRLTVPGASDVGVHRGWVKVETGDVEFSRLAVPLYVEWAGVRPASLETPAE